MLWKGNEITWNITNNEKKKNENFAHWKWFPFIKRRKIIMSKLIEHYTIVMCVFYLKQKHKSIVLFCWLTIEWTEISGGGGG